MPGHLGLIQHDVKVFQDVRAQVGTLLLPQLDLHIMDIVMDVVLYLKKKAIISSNFLLYVIECV